MNSRICLALTLLFTVVACSQHTEKKVDSANDDWRRMAAVEMELRDKGVFLLDPQVSAARLTTMDEPTLRRTQFLLAEYSSRGGNVIRTSQRKDVSVVTGVDFRKIEQGIRNADRLNLKAQELFGGAKGECDRADSGPSGTIPRRAADIYVSNLDEAVVKRLDFDAARVERVPRSCRQFAVTYPTRRRPNCSLTVLVDWNQIMLVGSDREIVCR